MAAVTVQQTELMRKVQRGAARCEKPDEWSRATAEWARKCRPSYRIRGAYFRADSGMRNAPPVFVAATRNPLLMTRSKMVLSPRPVFSSAHVSPLVFE